LQPFTKRVVEIISCVPHGRITTYGALAELAGSPKGARQVVRILSSCSKKYDLPWHRVVKKGGQIGLAEGRGFEEQKLLLEAEGIVVSEKGKIEIEEYLWNPLCQGELVEKRGK